LNFFFVTAYTVGCITYISLYYSRRFTSIQYPYYSSIHCPQWVGEFMKKQSVLLHYSLIPSYSSLYYTE